MIKIYFSSHEQSKEKTDEPYGIIFQYVALHKFRSNENIISAETRDNNYFKRQMQKYILNREVRFCRHLQGAVIVCSEPPISARVSKSSRLCRIQLGVHIGVYTAMYHHILHWFLIVTCAESSSRKWIKYAKRSSDGISIDTRVQPKQLWSKIHFRNRFVSCRWHTWILSNCKYSEPWTVNENWRNRIIWKIWNLSEYRMYISYMCILNIKCSY